MTVPNGAEIDGFIQTLYLHKPVSAFTAEIRALNSAGGYHGPEGHGIIKTDVNWGSKGEDIPISSPV